MARKTYDIDDRSDGLLTQMSMITGLDKSVLVNVAIQTMYSGVTMRLDAASIDSAVKLFTQVMGSEIFSSIEP